MSQAGCNMLEALCGGRRLLTVAMKVPCRLFCSLWFVLVLAASCLMLLICLQLQQAPGASFVVASRWPIQKSKEHPAVEALAHSHGASRDTETQVKNSPLNPLHLSSDIQWQSKSSPSTSEEQALSSKQPVTKRQRKLLLKSNFVTSGTPAGEEQQQRHQRLAKTLEERRRLLREVCSKYQPGVTKQLLSRRQVSRVYVEDRSKLLYCEVPKAGCSNWKRVLMVLGGSATSPRDIPHDTAHYANHLRRLESYDQGGITERIHSYTKVLFVREPFERLVSAFRDKFESPNSYYHPVFGRPIISRYRANATRTALRTGAGVTFREFVQYLLDVQRPVGMDIHWEPVSQLCNPCLLQYNFIGKFENLEEEANFLLQSIGSPSNLTFPDFKDRNPLAERTSSKITQSYFAQLSYTERQKAYDLYYMDYLMFNYTKPLKELY